MKFLLRVCFLSLALCLVAGCKSSPQELRILEKSRQIEPAWISEGVGLKRLPENVQYVICKDKVLDLPLGLKQAEASALHNLRFQLYQIVMSTIDSSQLSASSSKDFHQHLSTLLEKDLTKQNLKDFYFDKVSVPHTENGLLPEYYRVFVLAQVDKNQSDAIIKTVQSFIKTYPREDLRSQLGSIVLF